EVEPRSVSPPEPIEPLMPDSGGDPDSPAGADGTEHRMGPQHQEHAVRATVAAFRILALAWARERYEGHRWSLVEATFLKLEPDLELAFRGSLDPVGSLVGRWQQLAECLLGSFQDLEIDDRRVVEDLGWWADRHRHPTSLHREGVRPQRSDREHVRLMAPRRAGGEVLGL